MTWKPISQTALQSLIASQSAHLSSDQKEFWDRIHIDPEKWSLLPWSEEGNGFWVVATWENNVIWFNDIEDGFNVSNYDETGKIKTYYADQKTLSEVIGEIIRIGR